MAKLAGTSRFRDKLGAGALGADAIAAAATRSGGGKFTPVMKFEAGKTKYVQFLVPLPETPTLLLHNFIITDHREDGSFVYNTFISRRDPNLDGADGYDELWERFESPPKPQTIGLGVELVPHFDTVAGSKRKVITGFEIDTRQFENKEGETVEVPAVSLIIQAASNFWDHLRVNDDIKPIEECVFAVTRTGADTGTSYTFVNAADGIEDIEEELEDFFKEFDFDALLEDWADENRMKELIGPLPDDWIVNTYLEKNKKKSKGKAKGAQSTRSRREAPPEDAADADEGDAAPEEEAPATSRRRRFATLREDLGSKDDE